MLTTPIFLMQPAPDNVEFSIMLPKLKDKLHNTLRTLESFQIKNAEHVFNTGTSMPCFQYIITSF